SHALQRETGEETDDTETLLSFPLFIPSFAPISLSSPLSVSASHSPSKPATMVSDSELIGRLREFLKNSDLETTTNTIVRRKLEEDFGVNLSDKKGFIREQVDLFLQSQFEEQAAEVVGDNGYEEEGSAADDRESRVQDGDEVEEDEEEEEETVGRSSKRKTRAKGRSRKQPEEGKKSAGGGFTKLCRLSPQLEEFLGAPEMARTEVVKQLWVYIKEKELQDPSNKRNILCDEPLRTIFCVDSINMFEMNKALTKHIWPLDSYDVIPVNTAIQKEKINQQENEEEPDDPGWKEKRQKGGTKGYMAPLQLSDLETTTNTIVHQKLEEDFPVNLTDKKGFIREQVDLFLQSQFEEQAAEVAGDNEYEEEEEEGSAANDRESGVKGGNELEEDKEEEEETVGRSSKRKTRAKGRSRKQPGEGKKSGGGSFTKLCLLSPQLEEFLGALEMARTEVVKQLWVYIKEKELQDPSNKRNILCDEPLRTIFCVDSINMFEMNKALTKHIWPLDSDDVIPAKTATQKEKQKQQESEEGTDWQITFHLNDTSEADDEKKMLNNLSYNQMIQEGKRSGRKAEPKDLWPLSSFRIPSKVPWHRSTCNVSIRGHQENVGLHKAEQTFRYVVTLDPSDKRKIICDEKLRELFDVDSFVGFTVTKLLSAHFVKS
ncbi:unnamed protein product, partial [Linum tenue]